MLITSARDNKNNRWKKKRKTNIEKKKWCGANDSESVRATWFCCAFK